MGKGERCTDHRWDVACHDSRLRELLDSVLFLRNLAEKSHPDNKDPRVRDQGCAALLFPEKTLLVLRGLVNLHICTGLEYYEYG